MSEPRNCPFCASTSVEMSNKTTTTGRHRKRHIAVYCRNCHAYGPRIIADGDNPTSPVIAAVELAIQSWNRSIR